jgi:hypothetical protein
MRWPGKEKDVIIQQNEPSKWSKARTHGHIRPTQPLLEILAKPIVISDWYISDLKITWSAEIPLPKALLTLSLVSAATTKFGNWYSNLQHRQPYIRSSNISYVQNIERAYRTTSQIFCSERCPWIRNFSVLKCKLRRRLYSKQPQTLISILYFIVQYACNGSYYF